jgi:hypothetical protein
MNGTSGYTRRFSDDGNTTMTQSRGFCGSIQTTHPLIKRKFQLLESGAYRRYIVIMFFHNDNIVLFSICYSYLLTTPKGANIRHEGEETGTGTLLVTAGTRRHPHYCC